MFIAHLPSGYLLSVTLLKRAWAQPASSAWVIAAGVIGALAPDADMFYFYLVDQAQVHHHKYPTHWPAIWLLIAAFSTIWFRFSRKPKLPFLATVFSLGGVLHVVLDSLVGDIWWFAPFMDKPFALFTVQAVFKPWWLNFVLHWSFAVELVICLFALRKYQERSRNARAPAILKEADMKEE